MASFFADFFWPHYILSAFFGGLIVTVFIERLLDPKPRWVNRPKAAWILHLGLWAGCFTIVLAVFQRPYFAAAAVLAGWFFLVMVSNAKYHSLREPFVASDFEYFTDALRHPRLYIPFLGLGRTLLAIAGAAIAISVGWILEAPLTRVISIDYFLIVVAVLLSLTALALVVGSRAALPITLDPISDLENMGLATSILRYAIEERKAISLDGFQQKFEPKSQQKFAQNPALQNANARLPDLVVVQSESFFDVRRVFPHLAPHIMREWDATAASSIQTGRLEVAAWGANTVRTEFSFLSGLDNSALGIHRFNPYRKFAHAGVMSIAAYAKKCGYRTVCVHPYPASFYNRAKVFPKLGFDEFMDVRAFNNADKFGPYIGDIAVANKVKNILNESTKPLFIFVITMENHGPLHLEKISAAETTPLFATALPDNCETLAVYVRHLANADAMLGMLRDALQAREKPAYLCCYGDHVPILPEVYAATSTPNGQTDYLIWRNDASLTGSTEPALASLAVPVEVSAAIQQDENVADLGMTLMRHAGLMQ